MQYIEMVSVPIRGLFNLTKLAPVQVALLSITGFRPHQGII